ncbi:MAG: alanine--tRNA ligase [Anaerolineales bacterium]
MSSSEKQRERLQWPNDRIRQTFLDFFEARGHTIVPSASLVPGGDETLLFTNAGMVQFKDVFLGTGTRPYSRVANSQKCMRVSGKHNDLDDVGRDDTHHTFFEMLGNWSFGDYYKEEAISWAWELLTSVWDLPKDRIYATCFEDEHGQIPKDEEAAEIWSRQPGFDPSHIQFFGRDENFWEMADTGPCGPDTEIFLDKGRAFCDRQGEEGHECRINGDCQRYLELWNLVFIQYNRLGPDKLEPLPKKHVDTGMGFARIVSVLQGVDSNYETDLFTPILARIQALAGHSDEQRAELLTPYRVIADHARAATFLIGDGVVPGNTGRNYVCRMIIRRASRFGTYAGFKGPFMAGVAETVIDEYGDTYPEIRRNREAILTTITQEEKRFARTVEQGVQHLQSELAATKASGEGELSGQTAFELYATYGLPLEITRDIAREQGLAVDESGFRAAMETHREASTTADYSEDAQGPDTKFYRSLLERLISEDKLPESGVEYDPYGSLEQETEILAIVHGEKQIKEAAEGDQIEVVLPETSFYLESGGQVADSGTIVSVAEPRWEMEVTDVHQPVEGLIIHRGRVIRGTPALADRVLAAVHESRRRNIMRNHTATHLLHAGLRQVLGDHTQQAGSLVAPDRLRFDFTHPEAVTPEEILQIEEWVNDAILANLELEFRHQPKEEAIKAGASALFGETYGEEVRTVTIGQDHPISYELCGGTHVPETGVIGPFLIRSESSAAAGIRRIEALTGPAALNHIQSLRRQQQQVADELGVAPASIPERVQGLLAEKEGLREQLEHAQAQLAHAQFDSLPEQQVAGVPVITAELPDLPVKVLRELTDRFRNERGSGVIVLASAPNGQPVLVSALTEDLVERGLHAGKLIQHVAEAVGGGGGGRPTMAQAGGKDPDQIPEALSRVPVWVKENLG